MPAPDGRGNAPRGRARAGGSPDRVTAAVGAVVVGTTPLTARVAGGLLALAGLVGAVAAFPTYLVIGGRALSLASGPGSALVALLVPAVNVAMGVVLARGVLPKLGLAYAAVAAPLALGRLLIELYRGSSSTARPGVEVIAGQAVLTSSVSIRSGWVLGVIALVLAILAGIAAGAAWGRTVMDDGGSLDPVRPALGGTAVMLAVFTVLSMTLPAADLPPQIQTDPTTGMQTVVTSEGPQALLERPGLALLGGLLLAGAVLLCSVIAPSLRPRLAAVGGLVALAVTVLEAGLTGLRDALSSSQLEWTVPGGGLLLCGLGYAVLAALAWRLRLPRPPETPARGKGASAGARVARARS